MNNHCNLLQRSTYMLLKYLFDESYALRCKLLFNDDSSDGIAESIGTLFCTYDNHNSQFLTRLLRKPF